MRALEYQKEYLSKVDQKDLIKELHQEIQDVSFYRAHQEIQSLACLPPSMSHTPAQLKTIQDQVQKDFRKDHYQIQDQKETPKEAEIQKEKGDSRGVEM